MADTDPGSVPYQRGLKENIMVTSLAYSKHNAFHMHFIGHPLRLFINKEVITDRLTA